MPCHSRFSRGLLAVAGAVLVYSGVSVGGPLDPPPGPITPTPGPEARIAINATNTPGDTDSVFRIAQSGSYYLTGNVTGVAAKHGIKVDASDVTLDLNGFTLAGVPGSLSGVSIVNGVVKSIDVRGGTVRAWGQRGLNLAHTDAAIVRDVRALSNADSGIHAGSNCNVTGCISSDNGEVGIDAGSRANIIACTASFNDSHGIRVGAMSNVIQCIAIDNLEFGIQGGSDGAVRDCSSWGNTIHGIICGSGGTVSGCSANFNEVDGINAGIGSTVTANSAQSNGEDGISVTSACIVMSNTCTAAGIMVGDNGIHVTGSDNRLEGNLCTTHAVGIKVDAAGNFLVRNGCSGNTTNWSIVTGNVFAQIFDRTNPAGMVVNGNSSPGSLGVMDSNANVTY